MYILHHLQTHSYSQRQSLVSSEDVQGGTAMSQPPLVTASDAPAVVAAQIKSEATSDSHKGNIARIDQRNVLSTRNIEFNDHHMLPSISRRN